MKEQTRGMQAKPVGVINPGEFGISEHQYVLLKQAEALRDEWVKNGVALFPYPHRFS